jgi:AGZA family xanthine/uracil permease-like MFS transporter
MTLRIRSGDIDGTIGLIVDNLSVLAPILIFVAMQITMQAFEATPAIHHPAVVFAFFPPVARLVAIKLGDPSVVAPDHFQALFADAGQGVSELAVIVMLGNGFIITSMVWAAWLTALIDRRPRRAAGIAALGAVLTLFGVIHSVDPAGSLYLPWTLSQAARSMDFAFVEAYLALAVMLGLLSLQRETPSAKGS